MEGVDRKNQQTTIKPVTKSLRDISLKPLQQEIIQACWNNDVLVNLPTGYGKSMLYQYPTLDSNNITVVFVPLRALLWDAISEAKRFGLEACEFTEQSFEFCFSARPPKLLFLTPEKLFMGRGVMDVLEALVKFKRVDRFVIDEAHCVCQWGSDFRPHYAQLIQLRQRFPHVRILAMTATAPPDMRKELINGLLLSNCKIFYASYNRPNLHYSVRKVAKSELCDRIIDIIEEHKNQVGIVYCQTIALCEELFKKVNNVCSAVEMFHSKVPEKKRESILTRFQRDEVKIIFATICFGMGINKPNVRFVVHAGASLNCENYYQESGRGGRDGLPTECILLYYDGQQAALSYLIDRSNGRRLKMMRHRQLDKMLRYVKQTKECRRTVMFRILGEEFSKEQCKGSCDVCENQNNPVEKKDVTAEWLPILQELSNITCLPTKRQLVDILKGRSLKKARYFQNIAGRLKNQTEAQISTVINLLEQEGLLVTLPKKNGKFKAIVVRVNKILLRGVKKILVPVAESKPSTKRSAHRQFNKYLQDKQAGSSNTEKTSNFLEKYSLPQGQEVGIVAAKIIEDQPKELDLTFLEYEQEADVSIVSIEDADADGGVSCEGAEELNEQPELTGLAREESTEDRCEIDNGEPKKQVDIMKLLDQITQKEVRDNELKRSVFDERAKVPPSKPVSTAPSLSHLNLDDIKRKYLGPSSREGREVAQKQSRPKKYDLWN